MEFLRKKTVVFALCVVLVLALAIGGTLAYLRDYDEASRSFTGEDYVYVSLNNPTLTGDYAKLIPGKTIAYDPMITLENTIDAYLFVQFLDEGGVLGTTPNLAAGWIELSDGVYYRVVAADSAEKTFQILSNGQFVVNPALNNSDVTDVGPQTVSVRACAIQKDYITDVAGAWTAASETAETTTAP